MKHDKKPENDLKRLTMLAAGTAASVAVLAGGVRIWNGYQNGNLFRPDLFVSNHDYQENQIMFPEKNDYGQTSQTDKSDENHRLERDPQADDSYGKDKPEQEEYKTNGDGNVETDLRNANSLLIDSGNSEMPAGGTLPQGFENSAAMIAKGDGTGSGQNVIHLPSGDSGEHGVGTGSKRDDSDSDSDSDSGNRNPGGNGSNSNGGSGGGGGGGDSSNGGNPVTPTPDPTPTPTLTPTPTPDPTPVVDPDYPNEGDKPSLPSMPIVVPDFPSDGLPENNYTNNAEFSITDAGSDGEVLYYGAVLTDWKLLCSLYVFVDVQNPNGSTTRYRLTDYGDNFRIGEFPEVADGDFTVKFYFRPNAQSEWKEYTHTFTVRYAKVVVLADDDGTVQSEVFLNKGNNICLLKQTYSYYLSHADEWGVSNQTWESLDSLFLGWSLTPGGDPVGNWFEPTEPGRYVLYPLDRVEIPDDYQVYRSYGWDSENDGCYAGYLQALLAGPSDQDVLTIPEGIHELWTVTNAGTLVLPNSTLFVYPENYSVLNAYQVRDDNPYFKVRDDMLFSKDGKKLLGIPASHFEELDIPRETTYVNLPYGKSFGKIVIHSDVPPEMDVNRLYDVEIVVPANAYKDYFVAWNQYLLLNKITLIGDDGLSVDYEYIGDGLYSENGTVLEQIASDHGGFFTANPDVEIVRESATDNCTNLKQTFFSEKVKKFEPYSLSATCLRTIYISAENPPEIDVHTFGNISEALERGLKVVVPEQSLSLYQAAWSKVLGDSAMDLLTGTTLGTVTTAGGVEYMNTDHGAILTHVPETFTSFDAIEEEIGDAALLTEIGSHAFDNCTLMQTLEIPDTIQRVDTDAFTGCNSLELLHFKAADSIIIDVDAFNAEGSLRLAAFDAEEVTFEDETLPRQVSCYVTNTCESNSPYVNRWGASYLFVAGETGTFAYGLEDDGVSSYIVGATTDVSGAIAPPDGYNLTQFDSYALANCWNTLTISDEVGKSIFFIGDYAFYNSGISGTLHLGDLYQIGTSAFQKCADLTEVIIDPADYSCSIDGLAFGDSGLERITLPPNLSLLGSAPFSYCGNLKEVIFTGETPPRLETLSLGIEYTFGWDDWATWEPANVKTILQGDADPETYVQKWQLYLKGFTSSEEMTDYLADPFNYMWEWMMAGGEYPMEDGEYLPEFMAYVNDAAAASAQNTCNEGITKFYWYIGEEIPDGMIQDVIWPDINDYIGLSAEDTQAAKNPTAVVATDSDAEKASDSDAKRSRTANTGSNAFYDSAEDALDSVHYVTDNSDTAPQEEN